MVWSLIVVLFGFVSIGNAQTLVAHGDVWRYHKGTAAPQAEWKTTADAGLDSSWLSGPGGFGFANNTTERSLCQTLLNDMDGNYSTVAMRKSFEITSPVAPGTRLSLTMDFDDGFIAWLDGAFLISVNSPGSPYEPGHTNVATASHESSRGDSSAVPATAFDLGEVGSRLGVGTHVLSIVGLNSSRANSSDFIQVADLSLQPSLTGCESGPIASDITWRAAESPIVICGNIIIYPGVTLTIEPGVVVEFENNLGLTVIDGGRLIAEGTETNRIRFTRGAAATNWGGFVVNGSTNSPETRIVYADFDFNGTTAIHSVGGTVYLDHLNFLATNHAYVSLDNSSFVVSHCHFPKGTNSFEPVHGTGGIKPGGHGIFRRNFFGGTTGYSDVVDFTGGNRPDPIVHFINNVVAQSDDDGFDLDGTDAWVEGNIFLHVHRNGGTPDSAAAVSGGSSGGLASDVTIVGNLFFDCDNAMTAKQGNFFAMVNNTIIHTTKTGGIDGDSGAFNVRDTTPSPTSYALGAYLEANIIWDAENLARNYDATQTTVTLNSNLIPSVWAGPGSGNRIAQPLLFHLPEVIETTFSNWDSAQSVRDWFGLESTSPALHAGPNGLDMGGVVPMGVSLSGAPVGSVTQNTAVITVGFNRTGFGMPTNGWPEGMGYTHYKWRLDGGAWSVETPIKTPIRLRPLSNGPHFVEAIGKRDSGLYQNDPLFGEDAIVSSTATWIVDAGPQLQSITRTSNGVEINLIAEAGKTYSLLGREALDAAHPWVKVQDFAEPITTEVSFVATSDSGERFFELVSPAVP